jgi:hypothetical protein
MKDLGGAAKGRAFCDALIARSARLLITYYLSQLALLNS